MIIDFHTHIFPDKIAQKAISSLSESSGIMPSTDGTAGGLIKSMEASGIDFSVNLPVMTRPDQVDKVNDRLLNNRSEMERNGIISFGGMHPDYPDYRKKIRFLADEGVKGIKLHPAYQKTDLDDLKMMRIIGAASEYGMIVIVHAGLDIGIPDHNYSGISMILNVIDTVRPQKFVLAHMGGWHDWDNVKRYIAGADVWLDTAFSIGRIDTVPSGYNMSPEAFLSLCQAHGTDRILFGTDCPWAGQKKYVDAVRALPFTEEEMSAILGANAARLLEL